MPFLRAAAGAVLYCESLGKGPPVLFMTGSDSDLRGHHEVTPFVFGLVEAFSVIAYDPRGLGSSPPLPEAPSMADFAEDARHVLDAFGIERAGVIGYSFGGMTAQELNNYAWTIAIKPESTREQLEAALKLAERAVATTRRGDPTLHDTLAEVHFQLGRPDLALAIIDEAILRAPDEPYYREQRRRFTGERSPDDRPPDPVQPWGLDPRGPPLPPDDHGITV